MVYVLARRPKWRPWATTKYFIHFTIDGVRVFADDLDMATVFDTAEDALAIATPEAIYTAVAIEILQRDEDEFYC